MTAADEAMALMRDVDAPRWTSGPVPPDIAPLLKALADLAKERGKGLAFDKLQEVIKQKTGQEKGRCIIFRWIQEAGGEPWFRK